MFANLWNIVDKLQFMPVIAIALILISNVAWAIRQWKEERKEDEEREDGDT